MLNPFFLQGSNTEQGLIQDLVNEHLKIFGIDVYYLPRQYLTQNKVIEEVIQSEFNFAYPIEAYIDSYDGYGGQGTILSKFGIQELDDLNLIISRERWERYIQDLISNLPDIKLYSRPKEGDLIYFPFGNKIFEIKYVEHEKPFYQLKKNYVYELRCELFQYEDEVIDTGINFIDDPTGGGVDGDGTGDNLTDREQFSHLQSMKLVGSGSTATAITGIVNGGVRYVTVANRGSGYTSSPTVAFSNSTYSGIKAIGIATMITGIVDFCDQNENSSRVQGVELINAGSNYIDPPKIVFNGGGGKDTVATATIGNGVVGIITVTNQGSGYINPPSVNFVGICSASAVARAVLNEDGRISQIRIINAGLGYTQSPSIVISSPDVILGTGTYKYNEILIGGTSGSTARVKSWDINTKILQITNVSGKFLSGEVITGSTSGAVYKMKSMETYNRVDNYDQNEEIEEIGDSITDFSELNPFGVP